MFDEDSPASDYRTAPERAAAPPEPEGDPLDPTPADREALARIRRRERSRIIGMVVASGFLYRVSAGMTEGGVRTAWPAVLLAMAIIIAAYALLSWARPRDPVTALIRLAPAGEITAGLRLTADVVLQPRGTLALHPLEMRLVGRRQTGNRHETVYTSTRSLAARQSLGPDQSARFSATFPIPVDIPLSAPGQRVRYRIEVSAGKPPVFSTSRAVRFRAGTRRPRRRNAAAQQ